MARPKSIHLPLGTVLLQGFPREVGDALVTYIKAFDFNTLSGVSDIVVPADTVIDVDPIPSVIELVNPPRSALEHKAVGCHMNEVKNKYEIVTVAYNSSTKEAVVETVQEIGAFRRDAVIEFKKAASVLNFV